MGVSCGCSGAAWPPVAAQAPPAGPPGAGAVVRQHAHLQPVPEVWLHHAHPHDHALRPPDVLHLRIRGQVRPPTSPIARNTRGSWPPEWHVGLHDQGGKQSLLTVSPCRPPPSPTAFCRPGLSLRTSVSPYWSHMNDKLAHSQTRTLCNGRDWRQSSLS